MSDIIEQLNEACRKFGENAKKWRFEVREVTK